MDIRELLEKQALGPIDIDIEEGEIVTDMVVLCRIQRMSDTADCLDIEATEHTGGIVTHGILTTAVLQHEHWLLVGGGDDE